MDCSMPGLPVFHYLLEFAQVHVHCIGEAIWPSHPLMLSSPALNLSSIRVFPNESAVRIRWPKSWSFSISPSNSPMLCLLYSPALKTVHDHCLGMSQLSFQEAIIFQFHGCNHHQNCSVKWRKQQIELSIRKSIMLLMELKSHWLWRWKKKTELRGRRKEQGRKGEKRVSHSRRWAYWVLRWIIQLIEKKLDWISARSKSSGFFKPVLTCRPFPLIGFIKLVWLNRCWPSFSNSSMMIFVHIYLPLLPVLFNVIKLLLKVGLKLNIQKTKIMASGPITSWEIDGETVETVSDFIFLGSKITVDGDCSHEIKRCLLLGRKVMTNLDSILKSRDITLPT